MLKSQLIIELATALKLINNRDEELRIAMAANNMTDKALEKADKETDRLQKTITQLETVIEARLVVLRPMPIPLSPEQHPLRRTNDCFSQGQSQAKRVDTEETRLLDHLQMVLYNRHNRYEDGIDSQGPFPSFRY